MALINGIVGTSLGSLPQQVTDRIDVGAVTSQIETGSSNPQALLDKGSDGSGIFKPIETTNDSSALKELATQMQASGSAPSSNVAMAAAWENLSQNLDGVKLPQAVQSQLASLKSTTHDPHASPLSAETTEASDANSSLATVNDLLSGLPGPTSHQDLSRNEVVTIEFMDENITGFEALGWDFQLDREALQIDPTVQIAQSYDLGSLVFPARSEGEEGDSEPLWDVPQISMPDLYISSVDDFDRTLVPPRTTSGGAINTFVDPDAYNAGVGTHWRHRSFTNYQNNLNWTFSESLILTFNETTSETDGESTLSLIEGDSENPESDTLVGATLGETWTSSTTVRRSGLFVLYFVATRGMGQNPDAGVRWHIRYRFQDNITVDYTASGNNFIEYDPATAGVISPLRVFAAAGTGTGGTVPVGTPVTDAEDFRSSQNWSISIGNGYNKSGSFSATSTPTIRTVGGATIYQPNGQPSIETNYTATGAMNLGWTWNDVTSDVTWSRSGTPYLSAPADTFTIPMDGVIDSAVFDAYASATATAMHDTDRWDAIGSSVVMTTLPDGSVAESLETGGDLIDEPPPPLDEPDGNGMESGSSNSVTNNITGTINSGYQLVINSIDGIPQSVSGSKSGSDGIEISTDLSGTNVEVIPVPTTTVPMTSFNTRGDVTIGGYLMVVSRAAYSDSSELNSTLEITPSINFDQLIDWQMTDKTSNFISNIVPLNSELIHSALLEIEVDYDYLAGDTASSGDPWVEVDGTITLELSGNMKDRPESSLTTSIVQSALPAVPSFSGVFNMLGNTSGFSKIVLSSDIKEVGSQSNIVTPFGTRS